MTQTQDYSKVEHFVICYNNDTTNNIGSDNDTNNVANTTDGTNDANSTVISEVDMPVLRRRKEYIACMVGLYLDTGTRGCEGG